MFSKERDTYMIKKAIGMLIILILILTVAPISAFATARYEVLMIGDKDEWVMRLQEELHARDYLKHTPTGYFGTETQAAVLQYQEAYGLAADGKAGPETRKQLLGKYYTQIPSTRQVSQAAAVKSVENYYPGDKGSTVEDIQTKLKELQYYDYSKITGYYGPVTEAAVKRFQRTNDLTVDGVVGEQTMTLLFSGEAKYFTLYPGDRGEDVEEMQTKLKELGYYTYKSITGYFGTVTEAAVKAFQSQNGLTVDGKAGKNTRKVLYGSDAKEAAEEPEEPDTEEPETQETEEPEPEPEPESSSDESSVDKMIVFAKEQLGKPYAYSREGPQFV